MSGQSKTDLVQEELVKPLAPSVLIIAFACAVFPSSAEIRKTVVPDGKEERVFWWPVLPKADGWVHDENSSRTIGANVLVPVGGTFADAPAVIYAKALARQRMPATKTLAQLIAEDRREFARKVPGVRISEVAPIRDGEGRDLRCLEFVPAAKGSWERVAYGEEGGFYVIFTVSAQDQATLRKTVPQFEDLVARYRRQLHDGR